MKSQLNPKLKPGSIKEAFEIVINLAIIGAEDWGVTAHHKNREAIIQVKEYIEKF